MSLPVEVLSLFHNAFCQFSVLFPDFVVEFGFMRKVFLPM
jgi:hypothetical protein